VKDATPFSSQDFLMQLAEGKVDVNAIPKATASKATTKIATRKAAVDS